MSHYEPILVVESDIDDNSVEEEVKNNYHQRKKSSERRAMPCNRNLIPWYKGLSKIIDLLSRAEYVAQL